LSKNGRSGWPVSKFRKIGRSCHLFCIKLINDLHFFFSVIWLAISKGPPASAVRFLSKGSIHLSKWHLRFETLITFLFVGGSQHGKWYREVVQ
jgi:hypothetical protein